MTNDEIVKDIQMAENIANRMKQKAHNCDPDIIYIFGELRTITDRLFTKYNDISKDRSLQVRFNDIIKNTETFTGEFTYNCNCKAKFK